MKVIYMQQTIQMMSNNNAKAVDELINSGTIKQTQAGINYLLITIQDEYTRRSTVPQKVQRY